MVLTWLSAHDPDGDWKQFLKDGEPSWGKIVMSGHSMGSDVTGYIAKHVPLARAVMLAGAGQSLDTDPSTDAGSKRWSYQQLTHTHCKKTAHPPGWLTDNHFGSHKGTAWKTPLERIYSLRGACDTTMFQPDLADDTPFNPYQESTLMVWDTLDLGSLGAYALGARDTSKPPYACKKSSLCGGTHGSMLGGSCASRDDLDTLRKAWKYVLTAP